MLQQKGSTLLFIIMLIFLGYTRNVSSITIHDGIRLFIIENGLRDFFELFLCVPHTLYVLYVSLQGK